MSEFLDMGGYAFYIWLSYGIAAVILIANVIVSKLHEKQIKNNLIMRIEHENLLGSKNNASGS